VIPTAASPPSSSCPPISSADLCWHDRGQG
jgi:hypothetical protein